MAEDKGDMTGRSSHSRSPTVRWVAASGQSTTSGTDCSPLEPNRPRPPTLVRTPSRIAPLLDPPSDLTEPQLALSVHPSGSLVVGRAGSSLEKGWCCTHRRRLRGRPLSSWVERAPPSTRTERGEGQTGGEGERGEEYGSGESERCYDGEAEEQRGG